MQAFNLLILFTEELTTENTAFNCLLHMEASDFLEIYKMLFGRLAIKTEHIISRT